MLLKFVRYKRYIIGLGENFLTRWRQRIMVGGTGSHWRLYWVGSYCIIYVLHQRYARYSVFRTKVAREVATTSDYDNIQRNLDSLQNLLKKWQMTFSSKNCKVLHLGLTNGHAQYALKDNGVEVFLEAVSEEKDLGVYQTCRTCSSWRKASSRTYKKITFYRSYQGTVYSTPLICQCRFYPHSQKRCRWLRRIETTPSWWPKILDCGWLL